LSYIDFWTLDAQVDSSTASLTVTANQWTTWFTGTQITLLQNNPFLGIDGFLSNPSAASVNIRLIETVSGQTLYTGTEQAFAAASTISISVILASTFAKGSKVQLELQVYSTVAQTLTASGLGLGIGTLMVDAGELSGSGASFYAYPASGVKQTFQISLGGALFGSASFLATTNLGTGAGSTFNLNVGDSGSGDNVQVYTGSALGTFNFGYTFAGYFTTAIQAITQASASQFFELSLKASDASKYVEFLYISWIAIVNYPASLVKH
jgi:hypothetical protein